MLGFKTPSQTSQKVTGLQISQSSMGQCIPYVFGHIKAPHKLVYFSNFQIHQQSNDSKGKAGSTNWYSVNADFILGYGPMEGYAGTWENSTWYYVGYGSQSFTGVGTGTSFSFTISNNTKPVVLVMGVSLGVSYNINYSDYAGYGVTHVFNLTGTSQLPLYNGLFPLPNYGNAVSAGIPCAFYNAGINDPTITLVFPSAVTNPTCIVYYAQVGGSNELPGGTGGKKGGGNIPYQKGGLVFERTLGFGTSGNPIQYPEFSGDGSANIALGMTATLPSYNYEVKGLFGMGNNAPISSFAAGVSPGDPHQYVAGTSSGDCCPADVIADLITSGNILLDGFSSIPYIWNHGLGFTSYTGTAGTLYYSRYGGILKDEPLAFGSSGGGGGGTITHTYYRPTTGTPTNGGYQNISRAWDNNPSTFSQGQVIESPAIAEVWKGFPAGTTTSTTTLNVISTASMHATALIAVKYSTNAGSSYTTIYQVQAPADQQADRGYTQDVIPLPAGISIPNIWVSFETHPGPDNGSATNNVYEIFIDVVTVTGGGGGGGGTGTLGLAKIRNYCMAYGIFISGVLDSQESAATLLDNLCKVANCAPVWDGAALDFIPYCEQSFYGNGTSYVPPTAAGPLFNFTDNDFVAQEDMAPVVLTYDRSSNNINSLQVGYKDARAQFNDNFVVVADGQDITAQGAMQGGQENFSFVTNSLTAQSIGYSILHRTLMVNRKEYLFTLPGFWGTILTPMDLITLLEPSINAVPLPARIKTMELDPKFNLKITAEPFIYPGSSPLAPPQLGGAVPVQGPPNGQLDPGDINFPVIFEAIPALTANPEIWMSVSGVGNNWGGAVIWISTDGGVSYSQVGTVITRQPQGLIYSSNFNSHVDPDNVNTCHVDLTESFGNLASFTPAQQNLFFPSLYYLEGGGTIVVNGITLTIPYELVSYQTATLTAANKYDLVQPNRRGVFNTPITTHTVGQKFAFLGPSGNSARLPLLQTYLGVTLYFKFTSFNQTGGGTQNISDVVAYPFTPSGQVGFTGSSSYTITPQPSVYQGKSGGWPVGTGGDANANTWTDTAKVYFPQITAHFSTGDITYLQRDSGLTVFTVSGGGEVGYVSVYDPSKVGEGGGNPALTAFADVNPTTHYNLAGYIQIGTVVSQALAGGGGSGGGSGQNANDFYIYIPAIAGTYTTSQELYYSIPVRNITFPVSLTGTTGGCRVAPTGSVSVTLNKNGSSIGTVTIAGGATTATFTFASAVTFNGTSDTFSIVAPSTTDGTFSGFWLNIQGVRV